MPGVVKEAVLAFACVLRGALALASLKVWGGFGGGGDAATGR